MGVGTGAWGTRCSVGARWQSPSFWSLGSRQCCNSSWAAVKPMCSQPGLPACSKNVRPPRGFGEKRSWPLLCDAIAPPSTLEAPRPSIGAARPPLACSRPPLARLPPLYRRNLPRTSPEPARLYTCRRGQQGDNVLLVVCAVLESRWTVSHEGAGNKRGAARAATCSLRAKKHCAEGVVWEASTRPAAQEMVQLCRSRRRSSAAIGNSSSRRGLAARRAASAARSAASSPRSANASQ